MPYIPHTEEDRQEMLAAIGAQSIDELFREIPEDLRLRHELNIPKGKDERQLYRHLLDLANRNVSLDTTTCFLGAGIYDRFIPASVGAVISRGEFLTAYTPYQPEASQGYLQTIYEFQTMVANLYGMEIANASMYDGATAMAEAALMSCGMTKRGKIAVSKSIHPHYRAVLRTYAWSIGHEVVEQEELQIDGETACGIIGYPDFFGRITDIAAFTESCAEHGAKSVVVADPTAMGILPPPGQFGADIVVGEGQGLGIPMGYGGPLLGLFACRKDFIRQIPGRIVGATVDTEGRRAYTMTVRTREQDIRREKATSNICTNEALMALAATVYLCAVGKNGLRRIADSTVRNTQYAIQALEKVGIKRRWPDAKVFQEFVVDLPKPAMEIRDALLEKGILAGYPVGKDYDGMENSLLICCTEMRTREEIDALASALEEVTR